MRFQFSILSCGALLFFEVKTDLSRCSQIDTRHRSRRYPYPYPPVLTLTPLDGRRIFLYPYSRFIVSHLGISSLVTRSS